MTKEYFNATVINRGEGEEINKEAAASNSALISMLQHVIRLGELLIKQKQLLKERDEEWLVWVLQNGKFSIDEAEIYIKAARYMRNKDLADTETRNHLIKMLKGPVRKKA